MVKNGGSVLDAYGIVNVISPAGLPMRGIVGIWPDPIMFVAVRCQDVQKSRVFYEQLGFVEQVRKFIKHFLFNFFTLSLLFSNPSLLCISKILHSALSLR